MTNWRDAVPKTLQDAADVVVELLEETLPARFAPDDRELLAFDAAYRLASYIGGVQTYWPTAASIERVAMQEAVAREFNGRNHKELAVKYGLSEIHIYRLLKHER